MSFELQPGICKAYPGLLVTALQGHWFRAASWMPVATADSEAGRPGAILHPVDSWLSSDWGRKVSV